MKSIGADTYIACFIWGLAILIAVAIGFIAGNNPGGNSFLGMVAFGMGTLIGGGIYLLPIWICSLRDARFRIAILVLTLVSVPADLALGFGVLLWIAALIWSICSPIGPVPPPVNVHVQTSLPPLPQRASVADELSKLSALRDTGHLTDEEFTRQRARLLS